MKKEKNKLYSCFEQSKGLRLVNPNKNLVEVYKRKSKSALNMLSSAIGKNEYDWILDTSYYSKYFIVYALFMKIGIKSEIHDCTILALKHLFLDKKISEELEKSKELRVGALYYDKDFGSEEILKRANKSSEFCLKVEQILDKISEEEIVKIRQKFEALKGESLNKKSKTDRVKEAVTIQDSARSKIKHWNGVNEIRRWREK